MRIPEVIVVLAILACIVAIKGYECTYESRTDAFERLSLCIIVAGVLSLTAPLWLTFFPRDLIDRFELPNTIMEADRLTAPDGRVFVVSRPMFRAQRYGPKGFEKSFYVGKAASSAMSASGNILICTFGGLLFTFTPDGVLASPSGSCRGGLERSAFSYSAKAKVPAIAFNWFSALAVPLWHPLLGWFIMVFGYILFKSSRGISLK